MDPWSLAQQLMVDREFGRALKVLWDLSLGCDHNRWDVHLAMARCHQATEDYKSAIGEYQEVLRLAPEESATAYEGLGEIFVAQGRPAPTTVVWFKHAAEHFLKKGFPEHARRCWSRCVELDPTDSEAAAKVASLPPRRDGQSMDEWLAGG